ncbi:MAG: hypothetical protein L0228_05605 [Planctomycetes bacterium]|nr:hypothetical protein [Planctomycetota bacterium]
MTAHPLQFVLLAEIGEIIGGLVALIGLIAWIIQRIAEANKAMQPRPPRAAAPPPPAVAAGGARPAGQQADPLRNQVEEFLRRAGQAKQQPNQDVGQPRRPAQAAREIEVLLDDEPSQPQRRPVGAPLRPMESRPVANVPPVVTPADKRPARRSVVPRKRKSLAERAEERAAARTQSIARQVSHLGQRIIAEDAQFDVQLKAKFDHAVGTLAESTVPSTELVPVAPDTPAAQIAAMLANPDGVRQAIVLNEVLRRPTDRW